MADPDESLDADALGKMTIAQIRGLAEEQGITITKTRKADIIDEFLAQQ